MKNCRGYVSVISAGIVAIGLLSVGVASAASIPAWLDDGITKWNQENPETRIQFLDIKDSFVWYMVPKTEELDMLQVRQRIYAIAEANGYEKTVDEELVTTGKPPSPTAPYQAKKCWNRNFTLTVDVGRQRMLTTAICEDTGNWFTGFRIIQ